jgi:hypothetical protein
MWHVWKVYKLNPLYILIIFQQQHQIRCGKTSLAACADHQIALKKYKGCIRGASKSVGGVWRISGDVFFM